MPKVAYSDEDRTRIREQLVVTALELMAKQGIQHTTVEQVYQAVGISRTFFYSFFPTKEDLIVETLYLQQPRVLSYAKQLMEDPAPYLAARGLPIHPQLLLRRTQRHCCHDCGRTTASVPTVVSGELSSLPPQAGLPVWAAFGVLRSSSNAFQNRHFHQSQLDCHDHPSGHSRYAPLFCSPGSRRNSGFSD